jgi:DNA polymerase-1
VKWLTQYKTLDNVMAHAGEIGGVVGENLRKTLDWLPKARELLTIKCDVVLPVTIDALSHDKHDEAKLAELYGRFEFKTWLRELQGGVAAELAAAAPASAVALPAATATAAVANTTRDYETVLTEAQLEHWLQKISAASLTAVDTETTSLEPLRARIVGISLAVEPGHAAYIPLDHRYAGAPAQLGVEAVLAKLKPWLESARAAKLGQNLKYDMHVFANHGVHLAGVQHDTLLQSYVLESHRSHDMDSLAERHLGVKTITFEEVAGKGAKQISFDQVSIETAAEYSAEDADITLQLHHALHPQIAADAKLEKIYGELEVPAMLVLQKMERHGVLLDARLLEIQSREDAGTRDRGACAGRPALQSELAETDPGNPVRETGHQAGEKNADRRAVHRRRCIGTTRAGPSAAEAAA